ncbi:Trimethyllysine dioxygenase [Xylariaceae sp. FL1019]|nr:Trimethyllysine dioxygenase [Xylariaceae sp. FL1019]
MYLPKLTKGGIRSICQPGSRFAQPRRLPVFQRRFHGSARPKLSVSNWDRTNGHVAFNYEDANVNPINSKVPYIWLRDNCRCNTCIHQNTRQRNFDTFAIPEGIHPSSLQVLEDGIQISWSHGSHESVYTWDFLESYIKGNRPKPESTRIEHFGAEGCQGSKVSYSDLGNNETESVGRLTDMIKRNGFVFVTEVPTEPAETTKDVLEKIAFIRETHYGGFYDFIPDLALADTAYTNIALAAHTDTTYFTDPSGLQAFHLLSHTNTSTEKGSEKSLGGQSLLVDGFHAANILKKEDPESFDILASVKLPWHASGNEGITISPDKLYPVLEYDSEKQAMHRIRWNNDDRGVVPFGAKYTPADWYRAARKWNEILTRKEIEYWFQLKPGNVLIFDNWRVMHGRSAFTGVRRICGAYINRDDYISRWRNTNFKRDDILKQVIG